MRSLLIPLLLATAACQSPTAAKESMILNYVENNMDKAGQAVRSILVGLDNGSCVKTKENSDSQPWVSMRGADVTCNTSSTTYQYRLEFIHYDWGAEIDSAYKLKSNQPGLSYIEFRGISENLASLADFENFWILFRSQGRIGEGFTCDASTPAGRAYCYKDILSGREENLKIVDGDSTVDLLDKARILHLENVLDSFAAPMREVELKMFPPTP